MDQKILVREQTKLHKSLILFIRKRNKRKNHRRGQILLIATVNTWGVETTLEQPNYLSRRPGSLNIVESHHYEEDSSHVRLPGLDIVCLD